MATGTVLHFGRDECARLTILAARGFTVTSCGSSLQKLSSQLQGAEPHALIITEDANVYSPEVVPTARSLSAAPLILFENLWSRYNQADFDLVVPPFSNPADWLASVSAIIELSAKLRNGSVQIRANSSALRLQSGELRRQCEELIRKCKTECERLRNKAK